MSSHKNNSSKGKIILRKIELKPSWFIPKHSVIVGVWEGDVEHAAMVIPLKVWLDKKELKKRIERIIGGKCL